MHIPDGFLSAPVWAGLDATAAAGVVLAARRSQDQLSAVAKNIPLLGVMGAFVFGAQMINFPLAAGTSAHLVGGALMTIALGPWAASLVMTSVLVLQSLVFQDGGILALGANIVNMAMLGVLAAYLPDWLWKRSPFTIVVSGFLSVAVSAGAALAELRLSGLAIPRSLFAGSALLFLVMGVIEGIITLAAVRSIASLGLIPPAEPRRMRLVPVLCVVALIAAGIAFASTAPDLLENLLRSRPAGFSLPRRTIGGLMAMLLLWGSFVLAGRVAGRRNVS